MALPSPLLLIPNVERRHLAARAGREIVQESPQDLEVTGGTSFIPMQDRARLKVASGEINGLRAVALQRTCPKVAEARRFDATAGRIAHVRHARQREGDAKS